MKRLRSRTLITLILTAALAAGMILFCVRLIAHGSEWVGFFGATYYEAGAIYDSRGTLLFNGDTGEYAGTGTSAPPCAQPSSGGCRGTTPLPAPPWAATTCS